MFVLVVAVWLVWVHSRPCANPWLFARELSAIERFSVYGDIIWGYAFQMLFPIELSVCDAVDVTGRLWPAIAIVVGLALGAAVLARRRCVGVAGLAALWLLLAMLPYCGILDLKHIRADRYMYSALPATWLALSVVAARWSRGLAPLWRRVGFGVVWLYLCGHSIWRAPVFASDWDLWKHELNRNPCYREASSVLALRSAIEGRRDESMEYAGEALNGCDQTLAFVDRDITLFNLARVLQLEGRDSEAEALFGDIAEHADRKFLKAEAMYHLGLVEVAREDTLSAVSRLTRALKLGLQAENRADALLLRSSLYLSVSHLQESRADYRQLLQWRSYFESSGAKIQMLKRLDREWAEP